MAISPRDTQRYYNRVVEKMGRDAADETVELFLAPGVGHCAGGAGPDQVDLMKALSTWVESGTPPSRQNLVLTQQDKAGDPVMTRPMCKYPAWPRYKGTGDVNSVSSFECSTAWRGRPPGEACEIVHAASPALPRSAMASRQFPLSH
jgi:hypothetical protein